MHCVGVSACAPRWLLWAVRRLRALAGACANAEDEGLLEAAMQGGVGPPANYLAEPPPFGWVPANATTVATPRAIRGAHPWLLEGWSTAASHECDNGATTVALSALNDNTCDCADGTDEPGTSACSGRGGRFWCAPFLPGGSPLALVLHGEWLETGLVDDGACDCCDCSDEAVMPPKWKQAASCVPGQSSMISPPELYTELSEPILAAAHEFVRSLRLNSSLQHLRMRKEAEGMGAFLQSRQPQAIEYQQFQQIAQRHRMVSQALYHGFREPPAVLLANAAKAEAASSSSSISDDSSSAAMDVEEPLSISAPPYEWIRYLVNALVRAYAVAAAPPHMVRQSIIGRSARYRMPYNPER